MLLKVSIYIFYSLPHVFFLFYFYGNPTPPKLKNSSQLMVPPVLQGLISLFPPLNSIGLCVVWQWLVQLALPAWHILKLTHELTWECLTGKKLCYRRVGLLPAFQAFIHKNTMKWYLNSTWNGVSLTKMDFRCVTLGILIWFHFWFETVEIQYYWTKDGEHFLSMSGLKCGFNE